MLNITIEGNIGVGKTTLLKKLENNYNVIFEDVDTWKNEGWIEKYYKNTSKYAMGFQMRVLYSHLQSEHKFKEINIIERSCNTLCNIFGKLLLDDNTLDQIEFDLCKKFSFDYSWDINHIIYLQSSPEICFKRISNRNRKGEENIPFDYIKRLHYEHENTYNNTQNVYIINANNDIDTIYNNVINVLNKLTCSS